jgi:hypothetical protein
MKLCFKPSRSKFYLLLLPKNNLLSLIKTLRLKNNKVIKILTGS